MALFMDPPLNGAPAYLSQALAVVNNTTAGQPVDKPLLDTTDDQEMQITVGNNGQAQVNNVFVQYWVCAFSAGFSSSLFLPTTNGPKGKQIVASGVSPHNVPAGLNHVFPETFQPTSAEVASLADPQHPDADFHACILANVFSPSAPNQTAKLMTDAATPPTSLPSWDPANNPCHAQRNITLVTSGSDGRRAMDFMMHVGNPFMEVEAQFTLEIHETHLRRDGPQIGQLDLDHLLRHPRIVKLDKAHPLIRDQRPPRPGLPQLAVHLADELRPIRLATKPLRDLQIDAGERPAPRTRLGLAPDATRQIRLQATLPKEEDNALRIFDIVQTRDGQPVGGARVLFLNAPAEFRRELKRGG